MTNTFLVWSNEHGLWWRANGNGYTSIIEEAGRYNRVKARQIADDASVGGQIKVQRTTLLGELVEVPPEVVVPSPESAEREDTR